MTATTKNDAAPIGLETAAQRLRTEAPDCAVSRFVLYHLCKHGRIPCWVFPAVTGTHRRYKVAMAPLITSLRKLQISAS